jgi:hypothetical protein
MTKIATKNSDLFQNMFPHFNLESRLSNIIEADIIEYRALFDVLGS